VTLARKVTYFGNVIRKKSESLEKKIMQGTTPGSRTTFCNGWVTKIIETEKWSII